MPSRDPLEQIMGSLRKSNTVDAGASLVRESRMKTDRSRMGISPTQGQSLGKPPIQPGRPKQQIRPMNPPPTEFGGPGTEMSQDPNLVATLIDQLNEAIVSIKVQVQKELNPEVRSKLERTAAEVRQHIIDLGGQPIEAGESVDQGIQKLEGLGFVGRDTLDFTLNDLNAFNQSGPRPSTTATPTKTPTAPLPTSTVDRNANDPGMLKEPGVHKLPHGYETIPSPAPRDQLERTLAGIGAAKAPPTGSVGVSTPSTKSPTETFKYNPPPTNGTGHIGIRAAIEGMFPNGDIRVSWDSTTGEVVVSGPGGDARITPSSVTNGVSFASESEIIAAAVNAGAAELALKPGASIIVDGKVIQQPSYQAPDIDDVKSFMKEMGVDVDGRMTEEEYVALRKLESQKGFMEAIHTWNVAIEKFKNDSDASYNIASRKIGAEASKLKGQQQEEMASRGMYYSSVMSGALATVDMETMNLLSDIAIEAANRTFEMGMEVTRLQELQILDETITGAQARLEHQDRSDQLVQVGLAVQQQLTEMALHEFNANWQEYTWAHQQNIQYWQETAERVYRQEGEVSVVRWALGDPHVVAELKKHGALGAVKNSTPAEAARILSNVLNVSVPMRHNQENHDMNLAVQSSQIALNKAYIGQIGIQNAQAKTQNWLDQLKQDYVNGKITDREMISRMVQAGALSADGAFLSEAAAVDALNNIHLIANQEIRSDADQMFLDIMQPKVEAYFGQPMNTKLVEETTEKQKTNSTLGSMSAIDAYYLANSWKN